MSPSSDESKRSSARSERLGSGADPDFAPPAGDGVVARLERAVAPYAQRFAEAPATLALRETLPLAFGVVVLYLIGLLVREPFRGWAVFAAHVRAFIPDAFAVASIVLTVALAYRLAVRLRLPKLPMVATALIAFVLALPHEALDALGAFLTGRGEGLGAFARTLGASGLFTAIGVSLATAAAIGFARRSRGRGGWPAGASAVILVSAALFALHVSFAAGLSFLVAPLATLGDSFAALLLITAIEAALWLVGIHGPALLAAIVLPVYAGLQAENTAAQLHHEALPHIVVVSTFLFVFPGGAGATLPLVLLLLRSRVARLRTFAYATVVPSLFNINEPVLFGLPLVYNPVLAVPFVLAPTALACTTYGAMALGWVGRPPFYVPSTIPSLASAFLATLDWRACVLVAVNLLVAGAIWLPFVRVYERAEAARAARAEAAR